MDMIFSEGEGG